MEAYPLDWPVGYVRTENRIRSSFKQSMEGAQTFLREEIRRLGATDLIISTNIPVRRDGGLYTDYMNKILPDPGVAIFFRHKGDPITMCCDQYVRVWENIYALGKGIEAIRGMERWGVSEFLQRAFTGFKSLPEISSGNQSSWWSILGVPSTANAYQAKEAFRKLAMQYHPDLPYGNAEKFVQIKLAFEQAMRMLGGLAQ